MYPKLLIWFICTALTVNLGLAAEETKGPLDYSEIIKKGEIQEGIYYCMGGHLIMSIKYEGAEYKFTHSHGEAFEMGDFISAPIDPETKRMIADKAIRLTEEQEIQLIKKIKETKTIKAKEKDEHIQRIIRFSKYQNKEANQSH